MVAEAAFPPAPAAHVVVDGAGNEGFVLTVAAALLTDDVRIDACGATPEQLAVLRCYLPEEKLRLDVPAPLLRSSATRLLVRQFAAHAREQELLHARLRYALPARTVAPLPAASEPGLVALVAVGREATSSRGVMRARELRRVLAALVRVSRHATTRRERISRVLLHGWLPADELQALRQEHGDHLALSCVHSGGAHDEPLPAVRLLAHLAALQRHHRDGLFAVGFASPALDGAALIGIPSFYFDAATSAHWQHGCADGRYLIDARRDEGAPALSRHVNTFVRVAVRAQSGAETLALGDAALADLMTALRVWMPRALSGGERGWTRRTLLCRSGLQLVRFTAVRGQCEADARNIP